MDLRTVCFVTIMVTFFEVQCAVISNKHEYELQKINSKRVNEFPCGVPQKRVVPLSEIFHGHVSTDQKISPHVTVLHRCDNAGCCSRPDLTCSPATVDMVDLGFMQIPISGKPKLRVIQAVNHTSCSCQPPELPK